MLFYHHIMIATDVLQAVIASWACESSAVRSTSPAHPLALHMNSFLLLMGIHRLATAWEWRYMVH